MPGFNTIPVTGGGGGQPNMTYVGSIHMSTYNRSWAQAGAAGYYGIYSSDKSNGYAYFVGTGTTTGVAMNRIANISHSFTRIDIVAPAGDMVNLYKVKVKSTTTFSNPLATMTKNSAILIASGNFELPSNATVPFADILICGAGGGGGSGHGGTHGGGGGGGGGNVVNVTDYPIYGTTIVSVGFGGSPLKVTSGTNGGQSAFGPVYALGGAGGGGWSDRPGKTNGNGGGGGAGGGGTGGSGTTQTSSTGLGSTGSPIFSGGNSGGSGEPSTGSNRRGGGGGGATGSGTSGGQGSGGNGGAGLTSTISGVSAVYGAGGYGMDPNNGSGSAAWTSSSIAYGCGGQGENTGHDAANCISNPGQNGVVVVRFYTP